jgi:hypothetical protein
MSVPVSKTEPAEPDSKRCPQSGTVRMLTNSAGSPVTVGAEFPKGCPECGRELLVTAEAGADGTYATLPDHDTPEWLIVARAEGREWSMR